jgi:hypothetical protein
MHSDPHRPHLPDRPWSALALALSLLSPEAALAQAAAEPEPALESSKPGAKNDAAAAAPEPAAAEAPAPAAAKRPQRAAQVGLSPEDTLVSGEIVGIEQTGDDAWKFDFHGFFRGPMRLGIGSRDDAPAGASKTQFHAPPVVPDGNYTNWAYTNINPGPWAELIFQYGSNRAKMTTALASYNITTGSWRELQAQLGIDRAFLTLKFPDAFGDRGGLDWNVGVFSNRYGTAGKYDAGAYETYLFGRTRVGGSTLTANLALTDKLTLVAEHGIGAKLAAQPFTPRASGQMQPRLEPYEPYPGPVQQGATLLHHLHVGASYAQIATLTGHYMLTWTQDGRATGQTPDASMRVIGADLRLAGGWMGDGYLGFSSAKGENLNYLGDTLELIHSQGGWQFTQNYLGGDGYGTVNTLALQYTFSVAAFLTRPQAWWGDGADLTIQVNAMYNTISGGEVDGAGNRLDAVVNFRDANGRDKLKWGGQILYTPLPLLSFGLRADLVNPNMDDATQSFAVFAPRAIIRTRFVTHEQVLIQYAMYSYKANTRLPYPFDGPGATNPSMGKRDSGVFTIAASMWW